MRRDIDNVSWIARSAAVVLVMVSGLLLTAPARAAAVPDPAVDEYSEHIPGAGGDRPSKDLPRGKKLKAEAPVLTPAQEHALLARGADGEMAARVAARTAPGPALRRSSPGGLDLKVPDRGFSLSTVMSQMGGSDDGMGPWLVLICILTLVVALAGLLFRARSRGAGDELR